MDNPYESPEEDIRRIHVDVSDDPDVDDAVNKILNKVYNTGFNKGFNRGATFTLILQAIIYWSLYYFGIVSINL
jgi:hypothetical protein